MLVDQYGGFYDRAITFSLFDPLGKNKAFGVLDFKMGFIQRAVNVNVYNITLKSQPS